MNKLESTSKRYCFDGLLIGLTIQVEINRIKDIEYDCMSIRIIDFVS